MNKRGRIMVGKFNILAKEDMLRRINEISDCFTSWKQDYRTNGFSFRPGAGKDKIFDREGNLIFEQQVAFNRIFFESNSLYSELLRLCKIVGRDLASLDFNKDLFVEAVLSVGQVKKLMENIEKLLCVFGWEECLEKERVAALTSCEEVKAYLFG